MVSVLSGDCGLGTDFFGLHFGFDVVRRLVVKKWPFSLSSQTSTETGLLEALGIGKVDKPEVASLHSIESLSCNLIQTYTHLLMHARTQ